MNMYDHHANVLLDKYFDRIESPERELCPWCEEWTAVEHSYCEQMIREHQLPVRHRMDGTFELVTDSRRSDEAQQHAEKLIKWGIPVRWLGRAEAAATLGMEGVVGGCTTRLPPARRRGGSRR